MHLNYSETHKAGTSLLGLKGWHDLPDPFPQWQRSDSSATT